MATFVTVQNYWTISLDRISVLNQFVCKISLSCQGRWLKGRKIGPDKLKTCQKAFLSTKLFSCLAWGARGCPNASKSWLGENSLLAFRNIEYHAIYTQTLLIINIFKTCKFTPAPSSIFINSFAHQIKYEIKALWYMYKLYLWYNWCPLFCYIWEQLLVWSRWIHRECHYCHRSSNDK